MQGLIAGVDDSNQFQTQIILQATNQGDREFLVSAFVITIKDLLVLNFLSQFQINFVALEKNEILLGDILFRA